MLISSAKCGRRGLEGAIRARGGSGCGVLALCPIPASLPPPRSHAQQERPPLLKSRLGLASHLLLVVMYKTLFCRNLCCGGPALLKIKIKVTLTPRGVMAWVAPRKERVAAQPHKRKRKTEKKQKGHPRVSCACKIEREREISQEIAVAVALWWRKTHA